MSFFRRRHDASAYPEISSDREQLVGEDKDGEVQVSQPGRCKSCCKQNTRLLLFLLALSLIVAGHAIAIYFIYFKCHSSNCLPIKVMTLNCWGMPESLGSQYKKDRIAAIGEEINKATYDIYLLEELWMEHDYYVIRSKVPEGYNITEFRGLALPTCDGRVAPTACSGLAVVSKYPYLDVEFNSYTEHGDWTKAFIDGEWFARKGVGRVRIEPKEGVKVDVFVTHTAADPDPIHGYTNEYYRNAQVKELIESYVSKSTADIVLLGGDFNAGPEMIDGKPYATVRKHMKNSFEDIFYKLNEWLNAKYATYGNVKNTFSGRIYDPIIYDYIFYRTNNQKTRLFTNLFELPFFKLKLFQDSLLGQIGQDKDSLEESRAKIFESYQKVLRESSLNATVPHTVTNRMRSKRDADVSVTTDEKLISFSDHEAVTSTLYLWF